MSVKRQPPFPPSCLPYSRQKSKVMAALSLQLFLLCLLQHTVRATVHLSLHPGHVRIAEDESTEVIVSFRVTGSVPQESYVSIISDHAHVADVLEPHFVAQDLERNVSVTVRGKLIGKSRLSFRYYESPDAAASDEQHVDVAVIRSMPKIQIIFTIFVAILVSINNISMGCVISLPTITGVVRKPIAPLIGFACQFLIMPLASYYVGMYAFPDNPNWRLGLFVLGCCPGGTGSNFWTLLFDGDVDLSITMTFFSTIAAMGQLTLVT